MSEETVKRSAKKSDRREEKRSKTKKRKKIADDSDDLCKDHPPLDSPIERIESVNDPALTAEGQLSGVSPDASSKVLGKVKVSKKRKRADRDAALDESVNHEVTPRKNKKCDEHRKEDPLLGVPDPTTDEALSEQSRRALSYAFEQYRGNEAWKFNKARQNWLLRNVWSEQAIPENYVPLVIKYLAGIRGGAREKLIEACTSKMPASDAQIQGAQPSDHTTDGGSMIDRSPSALRALSIFHALQKSN